MLFASCMTMMGAALPAARHYAEVFGLDAEISYFGEHEDELGVELPEGCEKLVYRAELRQKGGTFALVLVDSLALIYSGNPAEGAQKGCVDGSPLEVRNGGMQWVCDMFEKLMLGGGKANFAPREANGAPEASLIDRFGVCWILRGEPT